MRTFARRAVVESLAKRGEPALAAPPLTELHRSDPMRHLDLTLAVATAHLERDEFGRDDRTISTSALAPTATGAMADRARMGLAAAQEGAGNFNGAMGHAA